MASHRWRRAVAVTVLVGCAIGPGVDVPVEHVLVGVWGLLAAGLSVAFVYRVREHGHFSRRMRACTVPARVDGVALRLGAPGRSAFVAGLWRPEIYCDRALLEELDPGELRAVLLHEHGHQRVRDPLRILAADLVFRLISWTGRAGAWRERTLARREIAADQYALSAGATRSAIASALLKVAPDSTGHAAAFAPATELRLRALLADGPPTSPPRWRAVLAGLAIGVAACLAIVHPIVTHLPF